LFFFLSAVITDTKVFHEGYTTGHCVVCAAPPSAIMSPRTAFMAPGGRVEFRCDVTGSPRPRVEWSKEGGDLPRRHSIVGNTLTWVVLRSAAYLVFYSSTRPITYLLTYLLITLTSTRVLAAALVLLYAVVA